VLVACVRAAALRDAVPQLSAAEIIDTSFLLERTDRLDAPHQRSFRSLSLLTFSNSNLQSVLAGGQHAGWFKDRRNQAVLAKLHDIIRDNRELHSSDCEQRPAARLTPAAGPMLQLRCGLPKDLRTYLNYASRSGIPVVGICRTEI
jgi:hypothetical protein